MAVGSVAAPASSSRLGLAALLFGWCNLGLLGAFLTNNVLINAFGFPGTALFSQASGALSWVQLALYAGGLAFGVVYGLAHRDVALRDEADRITALNNFVIRWAFWMVLLIGLVDMAISFLRIEGFLDAVLGDQLTRDLGLARFRGTYVHLPLMFVSIVVAWFTRTLGFIWLALLVVVAELLIVFSRFIYSYEQAFMSDLVRFWYGALFLFASAYTLVEEGHVRVDVFYAAFSTRAKGIVNAIGTLTMGIVFCWTILIIGMGSKASIINAPLFNFEVTQSGFGLYVKYLMAGFLGIFAISMMIQFVSYLLMAVADWRGDPGGVEQHAAVAG